MVIYLAGLGQRPAIPWTTLFPRASKKALDLLGKMLVINPADRVTVERALQHPFLSKYHDPDDEPICVPTFEFDFEKEVYFCKTNTYNFGDEITYVTVDEHSSVITLEFDF